MRRTYRLLITVSVQPAPRDSVAAVVFRLRQRLVSDVDAGLIADALVTRDEVGCAISLTVRSAKLGLAVLSALRVVEKAISDCGNGCASETVQLTAITLSLNS